MLTGRDSCVVAGLIASAMAAASCSSPDPDPSPACATLNTSCQALYDPPSYTTIYTKIFQPTCAAGTGTCHTSDAGARRGGLFFEDQVQAYQLLLGKTDGKARVLPANPGCSILAQRIVSKDPAFRMPPGSQGLLDGEICTIVKWLAAGAPEQ